MSIKKKPIFYTELSYVIGLALTAVATALMTVADFGLSMIAAPAYLLHLKISEFLPFYTFGMSEYVFQAFLLILLTVIMRKGKLSYLLSFVTALIYGILLDIMMSIIAFIPNDVFAARVLLFIAGVLVCSFSIALLFNTYLPPEAYELFVKEFSEKFGISIGKVKTVYDCTSCVVSIIMSFLFFGFGVFSGIGWGTVICALTNGWLIGKMSAWLEQKFTFADKLALKNKIN
jgi:uncharacterized membrane protein YczE